MQPLQNSLTLEDSCLTRFFSKCSIMDKKEEKSAVRHEEGKADASANDPMLKIEEDFESKQFGAVAQDKELDLYLVSFSCVIMRTAR